MPRSDVSNDVMQQSGVRKYRGETKVVSTALPFTRAVLVEVKLSSLR